MLGSVEPHKDILRSFVDGGPVNVKVGSTFLTFMLHCSWFGVALKDGFQAEGKLVMPVRGHQQFDDTVWVHSLQLVTAGGISTSHACEHLQAACVQRHAGQSLAIKAD
jgi:hypothetical protein